MKLLIDTNIVIPLEPGSTADLEPSTVLAVEFHRLAAKAGHQLFVHPLIRLDIDRDRDSARAHLRRQLIGKYSQLNNPPTIVQRPIPPLEVPAQDSNDWVDVNLLVALESNAVDLLITDDEDLHKAAAKVGLQSRVLRLPDIIASLKDLFDEVREPPPAVEFIEAYGLDEKDPIFDSLRADYEGFDKWLRDKCKSEHRPTFIIPDKKTGKYIGLVIINREDNNKEGIKGKVLKLCTFKVGEQYSGYRYGELLLKSVFDHAAKNGYDALFVTAFEKQEQLIQVLKSFGFEEAGRKSKELVLAKKLRYTKADYKGLDPLRFHVLYGPGVTKFEGNTTFIVPILPVFHGLLFPEYEDQSELFPGLIPCGNSIKKAYLSNSANKQLKPGDNILFYRSDDVMGVTAIGVVEGCLRSKSADEIARYVGTRTVYSFAEIQALSQKEILAIKFRLVKIIKPVISLERLKVNGVVNSHPQSIQKIMEGSAEWVREATGLQPKY